MLRCSSFLSLGVHSPENQTQTSGKSSKKNTIFKAIDKAPFAGKFLINDVYTGYVNASDKYKHASAALNALVLGVMVVAHAQQAKLGFETLSFHAPSAIEDPNAKDILYSTIDMTYGTVMGAVALRQAALFGKVAKMHNKWRKDRKTIPEAERRGSKPKMKKTIGAIALAVGVTGGGQVAEVVSAHDAWSRTANVNMVVPDSTGLFPEEYLPAVPLVDESYVKGEPAIQIVDHAEDTTAGIPPYN